MAVDGRFFEGFHCQAAVATSKANELIRGRHNRNRLAEAAGIQWIAPTNSGGVRSHSAYRWALEWSPRISYKRSLTATLRRGGNLRCIGESRQIRYLPPDPHPRRLQPAPSGRSWGPAATNGASVFLDIFEGIDDIFEDVDDIFEGIDPLDTFQSLCCHWTYSKISSEIRRFSARHYALDTFEMRQIREATLPRAAAAGPVKPARPVWFRKNRSYTSASRSGCQRFASASARLSDTQAFRHPCSPGFQGFQTPRAFRHPCSP
jgi:hypothetical protein